MDVVLIQMSLLILCGATWGLVCPGNLTAEQTRHVLTSVVYYFFLPCMVLNVLWRAEIGWRSLQYSLLGISCMLAAILLSWLLANLFRFKNQQTGAFILAAAFPNVTYLGLPVLEQTYGEWVRSVVIQIDLFAATPLVYSIGIMIARHYGESNSRLSARSLLGFFHAPPFWAALVAVALNLADIAMPIWLAGLLQSCSAAVSPLMIFSLGMALSWRTVKMHNLPAIIPIVLIKLLLMPLSARYLSGFMDLPQQFKAAAVMDIAMPSMILGIVYCDRYKLDSSLYATAVAITSILSLLSLPFWYGIL
jgi:malate permease and related proteins